MMWYVIAFIGGVALGAVVMFVWFSRTYAFETEWVEDEEEA